MTSKSTPTAGDPSRARAILWSLVVASLLVHLLTNGRYGYFRDELYYIACSRHLALGYVDMAPLCAWLLRLQSSLFGDSLFALRLFPAVASALTVALTGAIARELGGRGWAVALACVAALSAPVYLGIGNFYSMNVFEPLFWMGCAYLLVRIINSFALSMARRRLLRSTLHPQLSTASGSSSASSPALASRTNTPSSSSAPASSSPSS